MSDAVSKICSDALASAKGRGVHIELTFVENNTLIIMTHVVDGKRLSYVGLSKDEVEKFIGSLSNAVKYMKG